MSNQTNNVQKVPIYFVKTGETKLVDRVVKTDEEWKNELSSESYKVARKKGTELAYTGKYHDYFEDGVYRCVCCDTDLFDSKTKYDSGTGWPSFWELIAPKNIRTEIDKSHSKTRTEVLCARCDAHLGHLFDDGSPPTKRYCMNSASLKLVKREDL